MHVRRGMLDALPVQRVENDVPFQLDLVLVRHVLELAAATFGHIWAGRCHPVRRRLDDTHHLGEGRRALAVPDRDLHLLAGDASLDEHRRALIVMRKTQSTMDHPPETHLGYCSRRRSRSRRFTNGMSALPPVASLTARISCPSACCFPARKSAAAAGFAAMAASTSAVSSVVSLT